VFEDKFDGDKQMGGEVASYARKFVKKKCLWWRVDAIGGLQVMW